MKLTKARLQKIITKKGNQTRKKYKKTTKCINHNNTSRNKKQFNLMNVTLRKY
jgi:hypothetical protein